MTIECPKCRNKMEEGFIMDEGYGTIHANKWLEGPPEKSFWTGTKTAGKRQVAVTTYRCTSCGYLESYGK
jgi:predicted nucleic-acid-binding Zn-ribbon protein